MPAMPLFEQCTGTGSPVSEKTDGGQLWFRSVDGAIRTIAGYEAMNMIRKGQVRWLAKGDIPGQVRFIESVFGIAA
jgi:hypothetical protein